MSLTGKYKSPARIIFKIHRRGGENLSVSFIKMWLESRRKIQAQSLVFCLIQCWVNKMLKLKLVMIGTEHLQALKTYQKRKIGSLLCLSKEVIIRTNKTLMALMLTMTNIQAATTSSLMRWLPLQMKTSYITTQFPN